MKLLVEISAILYVSLGKLFVFNNKNTGVAELPSSIYNKFFSLRGKINTVWGPHLCFYTFMVVGRISFKTK